MLSFMRLCKMPLQGSHLLVAVSGGRDSVVLLKLLQEAGYFLEAAHANFGLRGAESDEDEQFVRELCAKAGIPCHVRRFDTSAFMHEKGLSLQEAARELRYAWFDELLNSRNLPAVAVAHHQDDQIETMLINLIRGTGIKGLTGMRPVNGKIIRPLLWARSAQIAAYARQHGLSWRDDSSNQKDDYLRNRIRHHLIPVLNELTGNERGGLEKSVQLIANQSNLYREFSDKLRQDLLRPTGEGVFRIDKGSINAFSSPMAVLYELLSPFGFNSSQVLQLSNVLDAQPGKVFSSPEYEVYIAGEFLEISRKNETEQPEIQIYPEQKSESGLQIELINWHRGMEYSRNKEEAWLDYDTLRLPLFLRCPRKGDRFFPLGMKGSQLLSDFFVNNHFTRQMKKKALVIADANGQIVWLCGHRIAHPYRISAQTRKVLVIRSKHVGVRTDDATE